MMTRTRDMDRPAAVCFLAIPVHQDKSICGSWPAQNRANASRSLGSV